MTDPALPVVDGAKPRRKARSRGVAALAALVLVLSAPVGLAQTAAPDPSDPAAAEAMLWDRSGTADTLAEARARLDSAAASGNVEAQRLLGNHLLNGWVLNPDPARGLALLDAAAAAGDAGARADLGQAYLWGTGIAADPVRAEALLAAAAEAGDATALLVLGEQLVGGWLLRRDADRGRALLDRAVASGDIEAHLVLGRLLLHGQGLDQDRAAALALFETAAAAGDGRGLAAWGEDLMWRLADPAGAEAMLNRAGELGAGEAWVSLAHGAMYGYLGGGRVSRAKFDAYADKARAAGQEEIAVLDATRNMWGISMRASGPETIARLRTEAEAGNAAAAGFLIELLRDGNRMNLRRDPAGAAAALDAHGDLLTDKARMQYALTLAAAKARTPQAWAAVAEQYLARTDLKSRWFGAEMVKANPNVAVLILQNRFAEAGLYRGPLDGFATRATLRAAYRACRMLDRPERCNDSVMRDDVIAALLAQ